jgi:hypothetical protein
MSDYAVLDQKMKQVFGIYRTGWTEPDRVRFLERLVRTIWKRGPLTTGNLSGLLHLTVNDELFQEALKALKDWNIIKLEPRPWGNAYVTELVTETTRIGVGFAVDLICERQKKGLPAVGE